MGELAMAECKRCGHRWAMRTSNPVTCAKCRSPYWQSERGRKTDELERERESEKPKIEPIQVQIICPVCESPDVADWGPQWRCRKCARNFPKGG